MNKSAFQVIRALSKYYRVPVVVKSLNQGDDRAAQYNSDKGAIEIERNLKGGSLAWLLSVFFHELGHHHCILTGKWKYYHKDVRRSCKGVYFCTKRHARAAIRTGYRAEKWVDGWAKQEMKKWFPKHKYIGGYKYKSSRKWLYDNHLAWYKKFL